jgi:hypothetical protein
MEKESGLHGGRERVVGYHQRSKHHLDRYARGPEQMDWATQPDPFRRFVGAPEIPLPLAADRHETLFRDLFIPGSVPAAGSFP